MMFHETDVIVPMFMAGDPGEAIRTARADTSVFQIKAEKSRDRVAKEILKRYKALPGSFWEWNLSLAEGPRRVALFYVLLKTYRLLFEFQVNLAIPKYNSPDRVLTKNDVQAALSEIASRDEFVDSWSGETRDRLSSQYLAKLRQEASAQSPACCSSTTTTAPGGRTWPWACSPTSAGRCRRTAMPCTTSTRRRTAC